MKIYMLCSLIETNFLKNNLYWQVKLQQTRLEQAAKIKIANEKKEAKMQFRFPFSHSF